MNDERWYGGIEGGGTKFVCAIGTGDGTLVAHERFATEDPSSTIARAIAFFHQSGKTISALGIGSFGPVDLRRDSPHYGWITSTPKPGWRDVDVLGPLSRGLRVPMAFDTDVNAAAFGEWRYGALADCDPGVYFTIGTGIGGGAVVGGTPVHGISHPEMGHVRIPHDRASDPFAGCCPYHGDCFEGLASGPALVARYGAAGETLADDHPGLALAAHYTALALTNVIFSLAPQRIVVGGGLGARPGFLERVRAEMRRQAGGYAPASLVAEELDAFVVRPALAERSGVLGAIALSALLH